MIANCAATCDIIRKHIHSELRLDKSDGNLFLNGVISSDIVDHDKDRFDPSLLQNWADVLKTGNIHLNLDHSRSVSDIVGYFTNGQIQKSDLTYLFGTAKLHRADKRIPNLVSMVKNGQRLGLSVECTEPQFRKTPDCRLITKATLLGVGLVTSPSCQVCRTVSVFEKSRKLIPTSFNLERSSWRFS